MSLSTLATLVPATAMTDCTSPVKTGDGKARRDKGVLGLPLKGFRSGALTTDKLLRQAFTQVYKHHGWQTPALQEFSSKA